MELHQPSIERERNGRLSRFLRSGLLCGCVLSALTGVLIFTSAGRRATAFLPVRQQVPFEFYLTQPSFSELENSKARMDAVCTQFITELRIRHHASALGPAAASHRGSPAYAVEPQGAIRELEEAIPQFKDTGQEMYLVQELLYLLKRHELYDRWLEVYFGFLYSHPTAPLVAKRANDAVTISTSLGRQDESAQAFQFLKRIPLDFPGKDQALAALGDQQLVAAAGQPCRDLPVPAAQ